MGQSRVVLLVVNLQHHPRDRLRRFAVCRAPDRPAVRSCGRFIRAGKIGTGQRRRHRRCCQLLCRPRRHMGTVDRTSSHFGKCGGRYRRPHGVAGGARVHQGRAGESSLRDGAAHAPGEPACAHQRAPEFQAASHDNALMPVGGAVEDPRPRMRSALAAPARRSTRIRSTDCAW